ncbi:caspase family protein [Streptomyces decoyicus]|uniref:caspase family protein n=1 Tax=Streptomyces decoyicus TaxID=249567 RepID=UPI003652D82A
MSEPGAGPRRYLIAAGTRRYGLLDELPEAHTDVERIAGLFAGMGYERVLKAVSYEPRAEELENALADWCAGAELRADDIVVCYYAGHGELPAAGPFRLACHDSDRARPRTWLSLENLASVLAASPVRNVLFIIDACHAGAGAQDIGAVADDFTAMRPRGDAIGSGTWVLSSARHRQRAGDGAFAGQLIAAHAEGDGPSQQFLSPEKLAGRINQVFARDGLQQRASCSVTDLTARPPFFTNPFHDRNAEVGTDGRPGADAQDLASHFDPRGRGVEHVHDPGSYFTGRAHALDVLRAGLSGPGGRSALVVTAAPGSGKSAVLGRLVLEGGTARSAHRIDVSVNARHQTLEAMVVRLAAAADVTATAPAELLAALAKRETPFRVVVDSLDEAGPAGDKAEARRIAWELLRPLGEVPCVRLVIGSRRELLLHIGANAAVLDLDTAEYADDTSAADYVERILTDGDSPYAKDPETARIIAEAVARRAGRCFLVARMTASALQRGRTIDVTAPGWAEKLPSNVGGAFEEYLERLPRDRRAVAAPLLTSLAFGEGYGLPRADVWARVAARLSGMPLTESDIDALVAEDGSYLTATEIDGRKHFRLYHQELTDHLRARALELRDLRDIQHCFVETLLSVVPHAAGVPDRRDWSRAPRYVREHLATHAAAAGRVDELIEDPSFVLSADITRLLPAVRHAERHTMLAMAIERCADMLGAVESGDRAAQLGFAAETHGAQEFARRFLEHSTSLERLWVEPRQVTPHRIVGQHTVGTYSTTSISGGWIVEELVTPGGRTVVLAVPPTTRDVHVWDMGDPSRSTVLPHEASVGGLVVLPGGHRRPLAVTVDVRGSMSVWDVAEASLVRQDHESGCTSLIEAGLLSDGTPVVLGADESRVTLWDPMRGASLAEVARKEPDPAAEPSAVWRNKPTAALIHRPGDGVWLLTADPVGGDVCLHPVEGQERLEPLMSGLNRPVIKAHTVLDGCPVALIAADEDMRLGSLITFDLASLRTLSSTEAADYRLDTSNWEFAGDTLADGVAVCHGVHGVQVLPAASGPLRSVPVAGDCTRVKTLRRFTEGRLLAVAAGFSRRVLVVDTMTGETIARPLYGHESAVCAVHLLASSTAESLDVLAIGNDGTARLWRSVRPDPEAGRVESEWDTDSRAERLGTWSASPHMVIATSWSGIRAVDVRVLGGAGAEALRPSACEVLSSLSDGASEITFAEGRVGDLHILAWQDSTTTTGSESAADPAERLGWYRLSADGVIRSTVLWRGCDLPLANIGTHFLPPTEKHSDVQVLLCDLRTSQVVLVPSPDAPHQRALLPWGSELDNHWTATTAFTTAAGDTVVMAAVPDLRPSREASDELERWADGGSSFHGYLWNVTEERDVREPFALPEWTTTLAPDHGTSGTRYIAITGHTGDVRVVDLTVGQLLDVWSPVVQRKPSYGPRPDDHGGVRWAHHPSGPPLLVHGERSRDNAGNLLPIAVWDPQHPEAASRHLPMLCRRILWTGPAPNGESLVAVSDEHGVALCHLPSCELIWRTPLPALVTSFALLPDFDMAVGTQQGVVLLRPRLSDDWRRRLGC